MAFRMEEKVGPYEKGLELFIKDSKFYLGKQCAIFKESPLIKIKVYIKKLNLLAVWEMKLTEGKAERDLYGRIYSNSTKTYLKIVRANIIN